MGGGLAFLTKKQFNPSNISNQKRVWEAEQKAQQQEAKAKEREKQLRMERDHEEMLRSTQGKMVSDKASLRFMYEPPVSKKEEASGVRDSRIFVKDSSHDTDIPSIFQRQDGDDEAAAAFRRMLAETTSATTEAISQKQHTFTNAEQEQDEAYNASNNTYSSLVLTGSTAEITRKNAPLTQLEKAVGKRHDGGPLGLTYEEQIARFPQLKNAPMVIKRTGDSKEAASSENMAVKFQPLGAQIRNVRCLKCGVWVHSRGDRECAMSGWDPFSSIPSSSSTYKPPDNHTKSIVPSPSAPFSNLDPSEDGVKDESKSHREKKSKKKRKHRSPSPKGSKSERRKDKKKKHHKHHKTSSKRHGRLDNESESDSSSISRDSH